MDSLIFNRSVVLVHLFSLICPRSFLSPLMYLLRFSCPPRFPPPNAINLIRAFSSLSCALIIQYNRGRMRETRTYSEYSTIFLHSRKSRFFLDLYLELHRNIHCLNAFLACNTVGCYRRIVGGLISGKSLRRARWKNLGGGRRGRGGGAGEGISRP